MSTSYSVSTIAKLFDLTERRVQQLAKEGIIPKAAKGQYELVRAVQGYIKYLRASKEDTSTSISAERARLVKAQADKLEMDMKIRNQVLLEMKDVKDGWITILTRCRSVLLNIPSRLAYQLTNKSNPQEIQTIIKGCIFEALTELSRSNNLMIRSKESMQYKQSEGKEDAKENYFIDELHKQYNQEHICS